MTTPTGSGSPARRFGFVQWEFPGRLGPEPGRYAIRRFAGDDVRQVLVISGVEAPRRRARMPAPARRRTRRADPDLPVASVEVTRATVIDADALEDDGAAEAWLAHALGEGRERLLEASLLVLSRAVAARRVAAADPWAADPDPARALATRIGYGSGDAVADGEWDVARELPREEDGGSRRRMLVPQERTAALLGGRDAVLACEELALRARADLDRGRGREAALQLDIALRAALSELVGWRAHRDVAARLDELSSRARAVAGAAEAAVHGGLGPDDEALVATVLGRLEAALRARTADG